MAFRKVNDDSLSSVADAIRAKGGTTEPLAFPEGFVSAIAEITTSSGGGGAYDITSEANEDGTQTLHIVDAQSGGGEAVTGSRYTGEVTMPAVQYETLTVELGFTPRCVCVTIHDDENDLKTYTVGFSYGSNYSNKLAYFFQDNGYYRSFTPSGATGAARGHFIGFTDTGFILQTCEPYFASKKATWTAL